MSRDLRDPTKLGEKLLKRREAVWGSVPLSRIADYTTLHVSDYVSPEHPHDRYGDPRLIPCTLPN